MEANGDTPHFWPQPTSSPRRRSPILSVPMLIIIFPALLLTLLFFFLPPFLSLTSQILRPHTVRRSWDTFNILLVLFAILCGVFGRRNDDGSTAADDGPVRSVSKRGDEQPVVPQRWLDEYSSNRNIYESPIRASPATGVSRLRRSSSSYPDLRQESLWEVQARDNRFRFYDDFEINKYNSPVVPEYGRLRRTRTEIGDYSDEKVIPVDTFVNRSSPPPPPPPQTSKLQSTQPESPATPPPPPPPPVVRRKTRRIYRSVAREENPEATSKIEVEREKNHSPATTPPPPPPPPLVHKVPISEQKQKQKQGKFERSKSMAKKEIAMVWASLGKRGKKKRKARNVGENPFDSPPKEEESHFSTTVPPSSPAPPPPPLPPPPSVFHSLFKKGTSKSKKIHSVPPPPPPPPPSKQRTRTQIPRPPPTPPPPTPPKSSRRPPLPNKTSSHYYEKDGNVKNGDVRVRSRQSSHEAEDGDYSSIKAASCGREAMFCPSPDVNVKADSFIARLRDEWRLEKINSLREKMKNTGQGPGPETSV